MEEKWYFKTRTLVIALLCVGPFVLPLVWFHPRFGVWTKLVITIIVIVLSYYLIVWSINSLKSINQYYQQILK